MKLKSIFFNFFTRAGAAVLNLLISILISRELGAEAKGDHALFVMAVAILQLFSHVFAGGSMIYMSTRAPLRLLVLVSSIWSIPVNIVSAFILHYFNLVPQGFLFYIIVSGIFFSCWTSYLNLLIGRGNVKVFNLVNLINPLVTLLVMAAFLFGVFHDLRSFAWGYLLAQGVTVLISAFFLLKEKDREKYDFSLSHLLNIYRQGIYILLANSLQFLSNRLLFYFIEMFYGKAWLGVYSNSISIAESVWMIPRSFSTVQIAQIAGSEDLQEAWKVTSKYLSLSFAFSTLCLIVILLLPTDFYTQVFGKDFSGIANILFLLGPAILFGCISNIYAHYFAGTGQTSVNFIGSGINLLVVVSSFFLFRTQLNELAAPLSASCGFAAMALWHFVRFRLEKGEKINNWRAERNKPV